MPDVYLPGNTVSYPGTDIMFGHDACRYLRRYKNGKMASCLHKFLCSVVFPSYGRTSPWNLRSCRFDFTRKPPPKFNATPPELELSTNFPPNHNSCLISDIVLGHPLKNHHNCLLPRCRSQTSSQSPMLTSRASASLYGYVCCKCPSSSLNQLKLIKASLSNDRWTSMSLSTPARTSPTTNESSVPCQPSNMPAITEPKPSSSCPTSDGPMGKCRRNTH